MLYINYILDIWCLGVLCFELLAGSTPFKADTEEQTQSKISNFKVSNLKFPNHFSKGAKDLIARVRS